MFSWIVTFFLAKTEKGTEKSLTLHIIALSKGTFLGEKTLFFLQKNADVSKIKRELVLRGIFYETTYECVLTCQIWSF